MLQSMFSLRSVTIYLENVRFLSPQDWPIGWLERLFPRQGRNQIIFNDSNSHLRIMVTLVVLSLPNLSCQPKSTRGTSHVPASPNLRVFVTRLSFSIIHRNVWLKHCKVVNLLLRTLSPLGVDGRNDYLRVGYSLNLASVRAAPLCFSSLRTPRQ